MIVILIRTLILYIFVLISIRLMGKGELAEMQPFELVVILMIAELAVLPMENLGVPLINGFVAIATLLFIQILISLLNLKSQKLRGLICGKPSILIHNGKINEKELKKLRVNINDLAEQIRSKGYPHMDDIEYAILETNGDLSVIPKVDKSPATLEDLNIKGKSNGLPVSLIIDGNILIDNLKKFSIEKQWLLSQLKTKNITDVSKVLFAYIDNNKELFVQEKQ
ncbi:YetF domain-containing protein [Dethiothermospora halolimnae]|uniref:YetF domain-containing protein n=1 Tax=Dethiothermospora halolimnae TaxID=3114390 RepID=UPI003CCBB96F